MPRDNLNISALQDKNITFEPPKAALAKWQPEIHAAESDDDSVINIYDIIGENWDGTGMTAKIVSSVLRKNKGKAITVNINSPGGSFFEGIAIYNLLKEHDGDVTVQVVGMAASAASIIAMAGDKILVAKSAFIMIHNAWAFAIGNKLDMQDMADTLAKFDAAMATVYADQTGKKEKDIAKTLDSGDTWMQGPEAVAEGYATALLEDDETAIDDESKAYYNSPLKQVDLALARAGKTRTERREIIKDLTGKPGATIKDDSKPGAGENDGLKAALSSLLTTITK